jgi:hypothetical protein
LERETGKEKTEMQGEGEVKEPMKKRESERVTKMMSMMGEGPVVYYSMKREEDEK